MVFQRYQNDVRLISVIIASYNAGKSISYCLDSLRRQVTHYSYEIVIADSSNDTTTKIIEEKYREVKLIRLTDRTYPGPARNAAVKNSKGDVLAFLDTDCTAPSEWIENIAKAHESGCEVVGGAVLNGTRRSYIGTAEHIIEFSEYSDLQKRRKLRMIPTCNLSIRREIFHAIGRFQSVDTGDYLFKSEDLLLCHRILELGYPIFFDPKIKVYHRNRSNLSYFLKNQHSLGFSSAVARRLIATKGSVFVKYIPLSLLIPAVKIGTLLKRMASYSLAEFYNLIYHMPLIILGSFVYTVGFVRGVRFPLKNCHDEFR